MTVLALPLALTAQQKAPASPVITFPSVSGYALDKTKVTLPADFPVPLNLLILSFARDQQSAVETWLPVAAQAQSGNLKIQSWILPVSQSQNGLYKWWLNSSMRSNLPADQPQHYTVPLYVNKSEFLKTLQIPSEKQITVLLTDKAGHVLWRTTGPATDENKASLAGFLKTSPSTQ